MRNLSLNQHRVDRLKPRNSTYDIRDTDLKGFGIRILPSGKKSYFLQTQHERRRRWTKIGDADAMPEAEARSQARSLLAGIRKGRESIPDLPADIAFEAVADEVFSYYRRHWKPRTFAVNLNYYQNNILPWFKGRPVASITRREVLEWFESLHAKPASANRSLPVLSVILRQAEVYGYRSEDSNPCKDIKRYRRRARSIGKSKTGFQWSRCFARKVNSLNYRAGEDLSNPNTGYGRNARGDVVNVFQR